MAIRNGDENGDIPFVDESVVAEVFSTLVSGAFIRLELVVSLVSEIHFYKLVKRRSRDPRIARTDGYVQTRLYKHGSLCIPYSDSNLVTLYLLTSS